MRKILLYLIFFATTQSIVHAQSDQSSVDKSEFNNAISIVPQYAFISGIRVDYERKLKREDKWILFAPQLYLKTNSNYDYDELTGVGMNVYYKMFLAQSRKKNGNGLSRTNVYFSVGPTYQHFRINSIEQFPVEFTEEGITYIRFETGEYTTRINKFGGNANFGLQFTFGQFLLDIYGGIGIRYALDSNGGMINYFNDDWLDFGYSGILLDGGVRLGFFIP